MALENVVHHFSVGLGECLLVECLVVVFGYYQFRSLTVYNIPLLCARYNIFPPDIDEAVALFFEAVDTEDDGVVSFSEFEVAEEAAAERLGFDISEDEIEALFEKVDENGDGVIDLQEAQEAVLAETPAPTPGAGTNSTLSPTPPPISSSKSSKSNPCAMIKGKKAKKKCLKKAKAPWN